MSKWYVCFKFSNFSDTQIEKLSKENEELSLKLEVAVTKLERVCILLLYILSPLLRLTYVHVQNYVLSDRRFRKGEKWDLAGVESHACETWRSMSSNTFIFKYANLICLLHKTMLMWLLALQLCIYLIWSWFLCVYTRYVFPYTLVLFIDQWFLD